jgi:hypothetical protein
MTIGRIQPHGRALAERATAHLGQLLPVQHAPPLTQADYVVPQCRRPATVSVGAGANTGGLCSIPKRCLSRGHICSNACKPVPPLDARPDNDAAAGSEEARTMSASECGLIA